MIGGVCTEAAMELVKDNHAVSRDSAVACWAFGMNAGGVCGGLMIKEGDSFGTARRPPMPTIRTGSLC